MLTEVAMRFVLRKRRCERHEICTTRVYLLSQAAARPSQTTEEDPRGSSIYRTHDRGQSSVTLMYFRQR